VKVLVFGATGQLGAAIVREFETADRVVPLGHADLDISKASEVSSRVALEAPDLVVNCAAYNRVDDAEDHPVEALEVNAFAVRSLARAADALGAILVHYSTDFVFDGRATAPYSEEDRPNPQSVYAASKLAGEWFAADAARHYVVRVESLFGSVAGGTPAKGSVAGIVRSIVNGSEVKAFEDRTISPTHVIDAARATRQLVQRLPPSGVYHCVNSGACTWLQLAHEAAARLQVTPRIVPVRLADVALRASRPQYCVLSNRKLEAAGISMPPWQDALARYLAAV
jgi:dTDP-4-dehydrorhamnose reductase